MRDNVIDTTKPSPGRMYDYYLGGNHNFEVDRLAANQVMTLLPFITPYCHLQRWALQDIAREFTQKRGFDVIIDYATGLPTVDHIHEAVPPGTTVIYSDYDPVVVEYGRQILGDTPNVYFFENDCGRPEELLNNPEVEKILGGRRKVGICFWGISGFLNNNEIAHAMQALYEWAAPGAVLAYNAQSTGWDMEHPAIKHMLAVYASFGQESNPRTLELVDELVKPWKTEKGEWVSLFDWHGMDLSKFTQEERDLLAPMGPGYGAYLVK